jgi:hypothetical protein
MPLLSTVVIYTQPYLDYPPHLRILRIYGILGFLSILTKYPAWLLMKTL